MAQPEPSELVFLADLDNFALEKKVRFLGCVRHHDQANGTIYLTHEYPHLPYQITARVNTDHVLEALEHVDCQVGAWLNVTGYTCGRMMSPQYSIDIGITPVYSEVTIRAVMIWNAGSLDLGLYEKALVARKASGTTG